MNYFEENHAPQHGVAYISESNVTFDGENHLRNNWANSFTGGIVLVQSNASIRGICTFINNTGESGGGLYGILTNLTLGGNCLFTGNDVTVFGGGIMFSNGTLNITGQITFFKNTASYGPALYFRYSNVTIGGTVTSSHGLPINKPGYVILEGAVALYRCTAHFTGTLNLTDHSASEGAGIYVRDSEVHFTGCIHAQTNRAQFNGGVMFAKNSDIKLRSDDNCSVFQGNTAGREGGAIYITGSSLYMSDLQTFSDNTARWGGALALSTDSKLILTGPLQARFYDNHASAGGGAIYYEDTLSISHCLELATRTDVQECFIELRSTNHDPQLIFVNNTADTAGSVVYGGELDSCRLYVGGGVVDDCGVRTGGNFERNAIQIFERISDISTTVDENITSDISSSPLQVCFCNDGGLDCTNKDISIVRGQQFTLLAVTVGQDRGIIPSSIRVSLNNSAQINAAQRIQPTGKECTPISYRLSGSENSTELVLFPDGPCRDTGISRREINVEFLPCPNGFTLEELDCNCEKRLLQYTTSCSVDRGTIDRGSSTFWMGVLYDNDTYEGLILHSVCPFDFCVDAPVAISLDDLDIQCAHDHSGTLCGACKTNYSIALGTLHCLPCSNAYVALILPFALAGVALVAVIILLNLSVATGTINGLIFYANIVQANSSVFFPRGRTNILTVFIAWLNLDLGIETCFYDGMNTYAFTWLQYLFPFYVWFLIGLIIVISRYSHAVANALGRGKPVATLATLFLLSYSKILRTVIVALTSTRLEY